MSDPNEILKALPHRYPFLFVDRIEELDREAKRIVAIKNVTMNEPFFQGHFPDYPIMPGVLIIEALAQAGGVLGAHIFDMEGKLGVLAGVEHFRFRRPVRPGDSLRLEVTLTRQRGPVGWMAARATVGDEVAAEGEIIFAIVPR